MEKTFQKLDREEANEKLTESPWAKSFVLATDTGRVPLPSEGIPSATPKFSPPRAPSSTGGSSSSDPWRHGKDRDWLREQADRVLVGWLNEVSTEIRLFRPGPRKRIRVRGGTVSAPLAIFHRRSGPETA